MQRVSLLGVFLTAVLTAIIVPIGAPAAELPQGEFRFLGPYGGSMKGVATDPTGAERLYAAGTTSGVSISEDGGLTWRPAREGLPKDPVVGGFLPVYGLAVDATDGRVYAFGGNSFYEIYVSDDHGSSWISTGQPTGTRGGIHDLLIDAADRNRLVASNGPLGLGIFVSEDRGATWTASNTGLASLRIEALRASPTAGTYFAVARGMLYRSADGGATWSGIAAVPGSLRDLQVDPSDGNRLYLAGDAGPYASLDGGATWQAVNGADGADIYCYVIGSGRVLAVGRGAVYTLAAGGTSVESTREFFYTRAAGGVVRLDGGVLLATEMGLFDGSSAVFQGTEDLVFHNRGIRAADIAAVSPVRGGRGIYAAAGLSYDAGVFYSPDGGETWELRSRGLANPDVRSMAVAPSNPDIVYIGTNDATDDFGENGKIYRTDDGGRSWTDLTPNLPHEGSRIIISICVDPGDPDVVYASVQGKYGGVYKSVDGGATWSRKATGLESMPPMPGYDNEYFNAFINYFAMLSLALDPTDPTHLYIGAGGCWGGVYTTVDGANHWTRRAAGSMEMDSEVPNPMVFGVHLELFDFDVDSTDPTHLVASGARGAFPGGVYDGNDQLGILFESRDRGATWSLLRHEAKSDYFSSPITGAAIDPLDGERIYVSTREGIQVSESGGAPGTWNEMNEGLGSSEMFTRTLAMDPDDPSRLYIATALSGVWVRQVNVTPVRLAYFSGDILSGDQVRLEWGVTAVDGNAGFFVDRETGGGVRRLTERPIAGGRPGTFSFVDRSPVAGVSNRYRLIELDRFGNETRIGSLEIPVPLQPGLVLGPAFPNPLRAGRTELRFTVKRRGSVLAQVFDLRGREVATLLDQILAPGERTLYWDRTDDRAKPVGPGLYFVRLRQGESYANRKVIVLP